MEKTTIISVRIPSETLDKLNDLNRKVRYWKRNAIIVGLLQAVVDGFQLEDIVEMLRYNPRYQFNARGTFTREYRYQEGEAKPEVTETGNV